MTNCHICSKVMEQGKGIILVLDNGKILGFCSGKCRKTYNNKRTLKRLKWTNQGKKAK